jgi:hypothetical protein
MKWPFTGPEGYDVHDPKWYDTMREQDLKHCAKRHQNDRKRKMKCDERAPQNFKQDTGLTVQGVAHNRVVGIILPFSHKPNNPGKGEPVTMSRMKKAINN